MFDMGYNINKPTGLCLKNLFLFMLHRNKCIYSSFYLTEFEGAFLEVNGLFKERLIGRNIQWVKWTHKMKLILYHILIGHRI